MSMIQENEPHGKIGQDTERSDDRYGGKLGPSTNNLDDSGLSSMSAIIVSVDEQHNTNPVNLKRKCTPSDDLSDKNIAHKPFRTRVSNKQDRSGEEAGGSHQEDTLDIANIKPPTVGMSQSAKNSRTNREEVKSGTYVLRPKRFENWKTKILGIETEVQFDENKPQEVFHQPCERWVKVKEPGDTTRFKEHLKTCKTKPVPVKGTLMGMGWLKKAKGEGGTKGSVSRKPTMPCRGVTAMDNPLVDQYLNRTGAGGGGAPSIHTISKKRFGMEYRCLTREKKDEVNAVQRAEWVWRNDHNGRVYATDCVGFTSSRSLAESLCCKCKALLDLKAFTVAISKRMPSDENMKFNNARYVSSVLLRLYARIHGLRNIIEQPVSKVCYLFVILLFMTNF